MFQTVLQVMIRQKTGLTGLIKLLPVGFNSFDSNDILCVHQYLMKIT